MANKRNQPSSSSAPTAKKPKTAARASRNPPTAQPKGRSSTRQAPSGRGPFTSHGRAAARTGADAAPSNRGRNVSRAATSGRNAPSTSTGNRSTTGQALARGRAQGRAQARATAATIRRQVQFGRRQRAGDFVVYRYTNTRFDVNPGHTNEWTEYAPTIFALTAEMRRSWMNVPELRAVLERHATEHTNSNTVSLSVPGNGRLVAHDTTSDVYYDVDILTLMPDGRVRLIWQTYPSHMVQVEVESDDEEQEPEERQREENVEEDQERQGAADEDVSDEESDVEEDQGHQELPQEDPAGALARDIERVDQEREDRAAEIEEEVQRRIERAVQEAIFPLTVELRRMEEQQLQQQQQEGERVQRAVWEERERLQGQLEIREEEVRALRAQLGRREQANGQLLFQIRNQNEEVLDNVRYLVQREQPPVPMLAVEERNVAAINDNDDDGDGSENGEGEVERNPEAEMEVDADDVEEEADEAEAAPHNNADAAAIAADNQRQREVLRLILDDLTADRDRAVQRDVQAVVGGMVDQVEGAEEVAGDDEDEEVDSEYDTNEEEDPAELEVPVPEVPAQEEDQAPVLMEDVAPAYHQVPLDEAEDADAQNLDDFIVEEEEEEEEGPLEVRLDDDSDSDDDLMIIEDWLV